MSILRRKERDLNLSHLKSKKNENHRKKNIKNKIKEIKK